jgi:predicted nucleic-acid-binding protein
MEIIDTNVLVRLLIDDKDAVEQTQLARQFLKRVKQVYITQIVQVETIWVLERAYKIPKNELISILKRLHQSKIFIRKLELFQSIFTASLIHFNIQRKSQ